MAGSPFPGRPPSSFSVDRGGDSWIAARAILTAEIINTLRFSLERLAGMTAEELAKQLLADGGRPGRIDIIVTMYPTSRKET